MTSSIWVSMTTTDLDRAKAFYTGLGYAINPDFSDANGACIELGNDQYFMIVTREFFSTMTDKPVADPRTHALVGINLTQDSRAEVDAVVERGLASGGIEPRPAQDYGFMYSRDLEDPDGNNLGFLFMEPQAAAGPEALLPEQASASTA